MRRQGSPRDRYFHVIISHDLRSDLILFDWLVPCLWFTWSVQAALSFNVFPPWPDPEHGLSPSPLKERDPTIQHDWRTVAAPTNQIIKIEVCCKSHF